MPVKGGPSWLPLHVKVVMDEKAVFDYVPVNATSTATLKKLVSLQRVPALTRVRIREVVKTSENSNHLDYNDNIDGDDSNGNNAVDDSSSSSPVILNKYTERAREFCDGYNKDLHLIFNNCWIFAFEMVMHVLKEDEHELVGKE